MQLDHLIGVHRKFHSCIKSFLIFVLASKIHRKALTIQGKIVKTANVLSLKYFVLYDMLTEHRGRDSAHSSRESLPQAMPAQQPLVSEFINISYDEVGVSCDHVIHSSIILSNQIEEYWREHVSTTLRDKSGVVAVNTFFLFNKLFMVSTILLYQLVWLPGSGDTTKIYKSY